MRHYLWYDTNNQLQGEMLYEGGWPDGADPSDPGSTDPAAVQNRDFFTTQPNFGGMLEYTCPCPPEDLFCDCARQQIDDCFVDESSLVLKPAPTVLIDGVPQAGYRNSAADPIDLAAGAAFTLAFQALLSDGSEYDLHSCAGSGMQLILANETMTFASGQTNTLNLTAPPLGVIAGVGVLATKINPSIRVVVRGI